MQSSFSAADAAQALLNEAHADATPGVGPVVYPPLLSGSIPIRLCILTQILAAAAA
jgi:hypothetical protein